MHHIDTSPLNVYLYTEMSYPTNNVGLLFRQRRKRWANVIDDGPTLNQCSANVSGMLGLALASFGFFLLQGSCRVVSFFYITSIHQQDVGLNYAITRCMVSFSQSSKQSSDQ